MKKIITLVICAALFCAVLGGCAGKSGNSRSNEYTKHSTLLQNDEDLFNTVISVVAYTKTDEEFNEMVRYINQRYTRLNEMYSIYDDFEGVNNIKTINDNAGKQPVKVSREIIDLLKFSKQRYEISGGKMNVAMGAVLKQWHDFREEFAIDETTPLPNINALRRASAHTDIDCVEIDEENMTVFITDENVSLDVGAVAKGFATEIVCDELSEKYDNFLISAGGNVKSHGHPMDGRTRWGVSIQNPAVDENYKMIGGSMDVAYVGGDVSVVCSGGYQRYVVVDGKRYHHIIDPTTLYPEEVYQGVSIICEDSGMADALSTTVFLSRPRDALALVESMDGVECILVETDGTLHYSSGAAKYLLSQGVSANTPIE